jgi:hypothetical protein
MKNLTSNIIQSNKGNEKIAYDCHFYNYKETIKNIKRWRCNIRGCLSMLLTNENNFFLSISPHTNHTKNLMKFNSVILKYHLKTECLDNTETPRT